MDIYINYNKDHVLLTFLTSEIISQVLFIIAKNHIINTIKQIYILTATHADAHMVDSGHGLREGQIAHHVTIPPPKLIACPVI